MRLHSITAVAVLSLAGLPALADNLSLSFSDPTGTASVSLNAGVNYGLGKYLIDAASGTIDGLNVVALVAPGGYPAPSADVPNNNLLYYPLNTANPVFFDSSGISFLLFGGEYFNLYSSGGNYLNVTGATPIDESVRTPVSGLTLTQTGILPAIVPEPSAFALFAMGLAGLLTVKRRRRS